MTIDHNQNADAASGDSNHRLKIEYLADEICRLLFGDSTNLLDDIFNHPLSIDYFNIYLSLPIFGQRVLYQRIIHQFDFDPPLLSKYQSYEDVQEWLIHYRLNNYIHTDIYIENLLALLLTKIDDSIGETSSKLYIFSTVTDVRQFYQFLQSTSGIKYWNFFIDSMRLLRSRRSTQFNRIDISYLNFIYKYYSRQHELHSITIDLDNSSSIPTSSTSDKDWFRMAINAMNQLRIYWLPRYLNQISRSKIKHQIINSNTNQIENVIPSLSSENRINTSCNDYPKTEDNFIKHTLDNISYIDYNPQQTIVSQSSEQYNTDEFDDTNRTEKDDNIEIEDPLPSYSNRSIEDYAVDNNLELFYRILVSDSLAGSPFFEYISQTVPKTDVILYQNCIRLLTDAEILLSIPYGKFKENIHRQFIMRYIHITATEKLPNEIYENIEKERNDLIKELTTEDINQYLILWKLLLTITKFLIPYFLNYVKFDRLRFLIQIKGKILNPTLIFNDLHRILPLVNFKEFQIHRQDKNEIDLNEKYFNETEFIFRSKLINCGDDLQNSLIKNQYNTTEKTVNTDEQCQFRLGERFPPLTDIELEEELRQFCTKFQSKDIKYILGKSFDVSITSHLPDHRTFIGNPLSHKELSISNELNSYTLDIMNSAREIIEIDHFVTNLMDESRNIFQIDLINNDQNSSPISPIFEEILLTDSSPSTTITSSSKLILNNNALESHDSEIKFLSLIGSYFINSPFHNHVDSFQSSIINIQKIESIKFAPKDASTEVTNLLINKQISSYFQTNEQKQLLEFIQNQITNHQWPLEEYIGYKGYRAWRALKLAADISNFDNEFILNYHNDFDWILTNDNLGSFGERNYIIIRDFSQRIKNIDKLLTSN